MKLFDKISIVILLPFLFVQCGHQEDACKAETNPACICDATYAPVCGCDEVTYISACVAKCSGVKQYTDGPCSTLQNTSIIGEWEFLAFVSQDGINLGNPIKSHLYDVYIKFEDTAAGNNYFKMGGRSSINTYFGSYTLANGNTLIVKDISMTEIGGTVEAGQFENQYFRVLSGQLNYAIINKDYLHITSNLNGQVEVMIFKKK